MVIKVGGYNLNLKTNFCKRLIFLENTLMTTLHTNLYFDIKPHHPSYFCFYILFHKGLQVAEDMLWLFL